MLIPESVSHVSQVHVIGLARPAGGGGQGFTVGGGAARGRRAAERQRDEEGERPRRPRARLERLQQRAHDVVGARGQGEGRGFSSKASLKRLALEHRSTPPRRGAREREKSPRAAAAAALARRGEAALEADAEPRAEHREHFRQGAIAALDRRE